MTHPPHIFHLYGGVSVAIQTMLVCAGLVLLFGLLVRRGLARDSGLIPPGRTTLRNVLEVLLEGLTSMMRDVIGPEWRRFAPIVTTMALFILISNLMGLIPGLTGPTSYIETNLSWALIAFCVYNYAAIRHHGASYAKHFMGPVPWLAPLMIPVEIVSHGARLLSLTIRLTANMFADHTLVALGLSFGLGLNFVVPWLFMGLGLFVAFLQAFIFAFLTMIYIGGALEEAH